MSTATYEPLGARREEGCCNARRRAYGLLVTGVVLLAFGLVFGLYIPHYVDSSIVDSATVCGSSSDNYDDWQNNYQSDAAPKYTAFYAYNLMNAEDWMQGETAILHEMGPWMNREYISLLNVEFENSNGAVSYSKWEHWEFVQELSCAGCDLHTPIVQVNPAYLTVLVQAGNEGTAMLSTICSDAQIENTMTNLLNVTQLETCSGSYTPETNCACCDVTNAALCTHTLKRSLTFAGIKVILGILIGNDGGFSSMNSEVAVNKTYTEFAYGYPNSLVGYMSATLADEATLLAQAQYTDEVRQACAANCESGVCSGFAPAASELPYNLAYLAHISCDPFNSVIELMGIALGESNGTATCALPGVDAYTTMCCLSGGYTPGVGPLVGMGCLVEVTGQVDDRNMYSAEEFLEWDSPEEFAWKEDTGCANIDRVTYQRMYEGVTEFPIWAYGDYHLPTAASIMGFPDNNGYTAVVRGFQGTQSPPTGVTAGFMSSDLSAGDSSGLQNSSYLMYVTEVYRPLPIYFTEYTQVEGINTNRYQVAETLLDGTPEMVAQGVGVPFDGVADLSYAYGLPAYLARPGFMYGNEYLLTQANNSARGAADGGGIQMFQTYEYTTGKAQPLAEPVEITSETVADNVQWYDTWLDVEPATGKTLSAHKRLMAAFLVLDCDPGDLTQTCALFVTDDCYDGTHPCSATNYFTPAIKGQKIIPQYWQDETGALTSDQADQLKEAGTIRSAAHVCLVVCTSLGVVVVGLGAVFLRRERRRRTPTIQV